jgi:Prolyl-tRNA synthetase
LQDSGIRVHQDWTNSSPGYKYNEWEMKGVPLRMEIGPRDIVKDQVVLARRDTGDKLIVPKEEVKDQIVGLLQDIQSGLFEQALEFRDHNTHSVNDYDSFKKIIKKGGFVRCGWDGEQATEAKVKEQTAATIRCIPFDENPNGLSCVFTGKPAKHEVIFAKAY